MKLLKSRKASEEHLLMNAMGLVLAGIFILAVVVFGVMLWKVFAGGNDQGTMQTLNDLSRLVNGLQKDESKEGVFYLRENLVLIGYSKSSQPMYRCGLNSVTQIIGLGPKKAFVPPADTCGQDKACLCICDRKTVYDICNPAVDCKAINYDSIVVTKQPTDSNNFGSDTTGGKFLALFNKCNDAPKFIPGQGGQPITKMKMSRKDVILQIEIS